MQHILYSNLLLTWTNIETMARYVRIDVTLAGVCLTLCHMYSRSLCYRISSDVIIES